MLNRVKGHVYSWLVLNWQRWAAALTMWLLACNLLAAHHIPGWNLAWYDWSWQWQWWAAAAASWIIANWVTPTQSQIVIAYALRKTHKKWGGAEIKIMPIKKS